MPIELTTAVLLILVASLCAAWVLRDRPGTPSRVGAVTVGDTGASGAPSDAWREAALRHYRDRRELEQAIARALGTPGAVTGPHRRALIDVLDPGARPATYAPVDVFA